MMPLPLQVAILTGQSDPCRWALSPEQERFLESLGLSHEALVRLNYPYLSNSPPHRDTSLLLASRNNALCYLRSRKPAERCREGTRTLLARAERTVFFAGSCGLEVFNNLALTSEELSRTEVFAFGPFARRRPDCRHLLIQGCRDRLSRWCFREADHLLDCGHMDYLTHPDTLRLARAFLGIG